MEINSPFRKISLILMSIMAVALIALSVLVHYHTVLQTDIFLSKDLQSEGSSPFEKTALYDFLYAVSIFGKPVIAAITVSIAALFLSQYKYYRETIYILCTPISAVINSLVKIIVGRPRPSSNLVQILEDQTSQSFPSGHVNFYTVFFGLLFTMMFFTKRIPRWLRLAIQFLSAFLIIAISFSRVYLGVHWVTDTVGGYLLGFIILGILLYYYIRPKKKSYS